MIIDLSHLTFIVENLDPMEKILETIFDAQKIYESGSREFSLSEERFFLVGGKKENALNSNIWIAIMKGPPLQSRTYNHVAFKILDSEYDTYLDRLQSLGLEIKEGRQRISGEGRSIYFYDYDNHLFELHTGTLSERLSKYENNG